MGSVFDAVRSVFGGSRRPSTPDPGPTPDELQAEADREAQIEQDQLRKNRVRTILTDRDDIQGGDPNQRKTVLGG